MPLRRCVCGCGERFVSQDGAKYARGHYLRSPQAKAQRLAASLASKAKRDDRYQSMTLAGFGPLTEREFLIYKRGHHNGWSSGYDMGRRKGYADANQEDAA